MAGIVGQFRMMRALSLKGRGLGEGARIALAEFGPRGVSLAFYVDLSEPTLTPGLSPLEGERG